MDGPVDGPRRWRPPGRSAALRFGTVPCSERVRFPVRRGLWFAGAAGVLMVFAFLVLVLVLFHSRRAG